MAFNLKSDLERHKRTVHRNDTGKVTGQTCINASCISPGKVFARKDNFDRHTKRCAKRRQEDCSSGKDVKKRSRSPVVTTPATEAQWIMV